MASDSDSKLGIGRQRFLSDVIEHALSTGRRTPSDFLRHFPPRVMMEALAGRAELRARILFAAVGTRTPVGERKTPESAAGDLEIALEVNETDPETILTIYTADDRVQTLDEQKLWTFVAEGEFWNATEGIEADIARAHIGFILERAVKESLLTQRQIVDSITLEELTAALPREVLTRLIETALDRGRNKRMFRDENLLEVAPISMLVDHVALPVLWERVVDPHVADAHDLSEPLAGRRQSKGPAKRRSSSAPSAEQAIQAFDEDSTQDVMRATADGE